MLMPLIVFAVFIFVWYVPVWLRQEKSKRLSFRTFLKSVLIGMFPVFFVALIFQILLGKARQAFALPYIAEKAFNSFLEAALTEELFKFLTAYWIIRKLDPQQKSDYVLIFGAVGLGFEITETLLELESVLAGVVRGMFAMHIIWQFWMGLYYWEYRKSKEAGNSKSARKNLLISLVVPFVLHGTNDFLSFVGLDQVQFIDEALPEGIAAAETLPTRLQNPENWLAALAVFIFIHLIFQIVTYVKALKASNETRQAIKEPEPSLPENEAVSGTGA